MTPPTGPDAPGSQDECATCGHRRWRHKLVDGQQVCTEYVNCACGGHFVELSYGTRMARFVEAAQKLAGAVSRARSALGDAMHATGELYAAMQQAGLLPGEDPHDHIREAAARGTVGKHAADRATVVANLAEALDIPDHWTDAAPFPATRNPFGRAYNQSSPQDDLHAPVPAASSPVAELSAEVAARYCPDCSHPYSYAAQGSCCMPVNAQTGMPVMGPNEPTRRCNCTTQDPAPARGREEEEPS